MSDQERFEAIGKAVAEYGSVKSDLALMLSNGEDISQRLHRVGTYFSRLGSGSDRAWIHRGDAPGGIVAALPEKSEMEALAKEILRLMERKKQLAATLKAAGMEPKD
jgi:hypothetical protein